MAHLAIEGLVVRYGTATALDGIDLAIAAGEMFVLLGGSGSGKTTLLRALGGFVRPADGRILLDGRDITRLPPHRRPVNTTFQSYALFPHMSVADNVAFGLRRQGMGRGAAAARVAEMLRLVNLEPFAQRRPEALSGGQRQRVALARALAPRPGLLLLDEPMSALDRSLRERTRRELRRIQQETATTFVLVTHDQDEALSMATRIGLLHGGRLEQVGSPAEIYEHPASRYVAEFMGGANVLPARLLAAGPPARLSVDGLGEVVAAGAAPAGAALALGLRPERLRLLAPGAPAPGANRGEGLLVDLTYRGDGAELSVRLASGLVVGLLHPLAEGVACGLPAPGQAVSFAFAPDACMLLGA